MGKSAPQQPETTTVQQESIPEFLRPAVLDVVGRAQGVANQPYTPYPYERIAGFTPAQQQVQQNILGMQAPGQFAYGSGLAAAAGQGSLQASDYSPTQFQGGVFDTSAAQQYMSPYMQNVVDVQKREAVRDAQRGQLMQDLGAARQGTYGGSRQLLAGLERERQLGQQLGDIQARGQQAAFQQAQQMFGQDRAARLQAEQMGEQSRQFGARQGLAGLAQAGQMAQTLGNLGQYQQTADMQRLNMQQQAAGMPQALEQQRLDQLYADFLRQRDYPMETLGFYSNIIRGLPAGSQTTRLTYRQPTNPLSYVAGGLGQLAPALVGGG